MARLVRSITQPWSPSRIGDELLAAFGGGFSEMTGAVGFVNASGVRHIAAALESFHGQGRRVRMLVGVDGTVTSAPGVRALRRLVDELWLFRHPARPLFHPKTYLFRGQPTGLAMVGSANLTESALWVNYEDAVVIEFDLNDPDDVALFDDLERSFTSAIASPNAHRANARLIVRLERAGLLPSEARTRRKDERRDRAGDTTAARRGLGNVFPATAAPPPPFAAPLAEEIADATANPAPPAATPAPPPAAPATPVPATPIAGPTHRGFVLRLNPGDATIRAGHSPDIFIPLAALRADPNFWGTFTGTGFPQRYPAVAVTRRSGSTEIVRPRLYQNPQKHDLRLNCRELQADAVGGDLMRLELAPPASGVEYVAQVVKPGDSTFSRYDAIASNRVRSSQKRWGFY